MQTNTEIMLMSAKDKIGEAMRRSLPAIPLHARAIVEALLKPQTFAVIAGTLIIWAGSHVVGVGEIVDILLLGIGVVTLGFSVFEGAEELYKFVTSAVKAQSNADLDKAGQHFARAVTLLGISTIQAVLLRGQGIAVIARGKPKVYPMPYVGASPTTGSRLVSSRPAQISGGRTLGSTTAYGSIKVARKRKMTGGSMNR